jgi:hypothetical protein
MARHRQRSEASAWTAGLLAGCLLWLPNLAAAEPPPAAAEARWTFGVAPGFVHFTRARSETRAASSPARDAFRLSLPCHVGVRGFGVELEPALALGDVTSLSLYLGPALDVTFRRWLLRFGAGLWLGRNLQAAVYRAGFDIYGRLPITLAHSFGARLGLFVSVAVGFGATQVVTPLRAVREREFQSATAFDAAIGVWL